MPWGKSKRKSEEEAIATAGNQGEPQGQRRPPKKRTIREKWRLVSLNNKLIVIFSGMTMLATIIYSGFAGWQLYEIHAGASDTHVLAKAAKKQADKAETISNSIALAVTAMQTSANATKSSAETAKKILEATNRPYIGSDDLSITNDPKEHRLGYGFHIKNFSPGAPAYAVNIKWCPVIPGYPRSGGHHFPSNPAIFYPGQGVHFGAAIGGIVYDNVMNGTATLTVTLYGTYEDIDHKRYVYCNTERFDPDAGFLDLGACDLPDALKIAQENDCH